MNGLILLDKIAGLSSFAALGELKRRLQTRKIGHTGTLDPFATGLMVVLVGGFTRLAGQITDLDKKYDAVLRFGAITDTLDRDGSITDECPLPDRSELEQVITRYTGSITQRPPAFSAIRINGRRAYDIARAGETPDIPERRVEVFSCTLTSYDPPMAALSVHCSKGTYIRSLARDIATDAGSCCYVDQLRRTAVGPFSVADAIPANDFVANHHLLGGREALAALPGARCATVKDDAIARLGNGGKLTLADLVDATEADGLYGLFDREEHLLALADSVSGRFRYRCVLAAGAQG